MLLDHPPESPRAPEDPARGRGARPRVSVISLPQRTRSTALGCDITNKHAIDRLTPDQRNGARRTRSALRLPRADLRYCKSATPSPMTTRIPRAPAPSARGLHLQPAGDARKVPEDPPGGSRKHRRHPRALLLGDGAGAIVHANWAGPSSSSTAAPPSAEPDHRPARDGRDVPRGLELVLRRRGRRGWCRSISHRHQRRACQRWSAGHGAGPG